MLGYLFRILIVYVDLYTDIPVFNSGSDTEYYHDEGIQYMKYGYTSGIDNNYDLFLGIIYTITDGSRLFAQYLNVLMGTGTILILMNLLKMFNVPLKRIKLIAFASTFMPMLIINSSILLREAWIEFFLLLSLYWFSKWFLCNGSVGAIVMSVVCVFLSSWMHAGCFFVFIGYFLAFITYNRRKGRVMFSRSSISAIFILSLLLLVFIANIGVLGKKISGAFTDFDPGFISERAEGDPGGGSTYLTWLPLTYSYVDFIYLPIRMFYFIFSPIPTDWRGLNDFIGFIIDSSIYIWLFCHIIIGKSRNKKEILLCRYLLIAIFLVVVVFSIGTFQSGNAMRHRAKVVPMLFFIYSLKYKKKELLKVDFHG